MDFLFGCSIEIGKLQVLIGSPVPRIGPSCSGVIRHRNDHFVSFSAYHCRYKTSSSDKSIHPGRTLVDKEKKGRKTNQSVLKQVQLDWPVPELTIRISNTLTLTQGDAGEPPTLSADASESRLEIHATAYLLSFILSLVQNIIDLIPKSQA